MVNIALMIDGIDLPNWQAELLRQLLGNELFIISLLDVSSGSTEVVDTHSPLHRRGLLFLLTRLLDRRKPPQDAFTSVNLRELLQKDLAVNSVLRWNRSIPLNSSLIINLTSGVEDNETASIFDLPVWGIRFGQGKDITSPFAGIREVLSFDPVTILRIIEVLPQGQQERILYEANSATRFYSTRISAGQLAWKTVDRLPRLLEERFPLSGQPDPPTISKTLSPIVQVPNNKPIIPEKGSVISSQFGRWFFSQVLKRLKKTLFRSQWLLMTGKKSPTSFMPTNLKKIYPPRDRLWADPFCIQWQGTTFVFFEELPFKTGRGRISCAPIHSDGSLGEVKPVLECDYHLSYPFLLKQRNDLFMIPESAENSTVGVFHCRRFPDQWEHIGNLFSNVKAWDSTLFHHDGLWWLFSNMTPMDGISDWDQLYLFHSSTFPTDQWTPHPANPILDDVCFSRPAGKLFHQNGTLIRPSQSSAGGYGYGLNFNKIEKLTPNSYKEVVIEQHSGPEVCRSLKGIHTYNTSGDIVILDGLVTRLKSRK